MPLLPGFGSYQMIQSLFGQTNPRLMGFPRSAGLPSRFCRNSAAQEGPASPLCRHSPCVARSPCSPGTGAAWSMAMEEMRQTLSGGRGPVSGRERPAVATDLTCGTYILGTVEDILMTESSWNMGITSFGFLFSLVSRGFSQTGLASAPRIHALTDQRKDRSLKFFGDSGLKKSWHIVSPPFLSVYIIQD